MKTIELTRGHVALVDDSDFDFLNQWKWTYTSGYASRNRKIDGRRRGIKMHQMLVKTPEGMEVDHIDGNSLNNQKSNLRVCSHAENCRNQKRHYNNSTGVKGVDFHKKTQKFRARITLSYVVHIIGMFKTLDEARDAYNEAALALHGNFARLNSKV